MRLRGGDDPQEFIEQHDVALGRMVRTTRQLEFFGYMIARLLGVLEPGKGSASQALLAARCQASNGLPPWSSPESQKPVRVWISRSLRALEQRNDHVHGLLEWRRTAGTNEWRTVLRSMKEGDLETASDPRYYEPVDELDRLTAKVKGLVSGVFDVVDALSIPVGEARTQSHPALTGTRQVPSDDDVRQWFATIGNTEVDPSWITWPRERYDAQIRHEYLKNAPVLFVDPATAPAVGQPSEVSSGQ